MIQAPGGSTLKLARSFPFENKAILSETQQLILDYHCHLASDLAGSFFGRLSGLFCFVKVNSSDEAGHAEDDVHGEGELVGEEQRTGGVVINFFLRHWRCRKRLYLASFSG